MTPKEKAKDLVDKHLKLCVEKDYHQDFKLIQAKRGALIAVDEIVKECSEWVGGDFSRWEQSRIDYWQEVKSEIERI
jgi:hypothetical protein